MPNLWPMIRIHAAAAAAFAVVFVVVSRLTPNSIVLLGVTVVYAILVNRWVAAAMPKLPFMQRRKGSFKPEKGAGWKAFRWAAVLVLTGLGVQIGVFLGVYLLLTLASP